MSSAIPAGQSSMDELVEAARAGDQAAFDRLVAPLRRELQVHCYRMLGSLEDAEDAVQESLLRAWTRLDSFGGRSTFRAWVYGISTHACLDALRRRKARAWPTDLAGPADPRRYALGALDEPWLQPYPDHLLPAAEGTDQPETLAVARETIELAFLAAIQRLPARQRAVLILRDTLDWSVRDTAAALEMTSAAVNSSLQRAHATLATHLPAQRSQWRVDPTTASERAALQRLITAWERGDPAALVELLRADARLVMPPGAVWFEGAADIAAFLTEHVFGEMGHGWRLRPTAANRQPAFGAYWRRPGDERFRAFAIGLLHLDGDRISQISLFQQPELFASFQLPETT